MTKRILLFALIGALAAVAFVPMNANTSVAQDGEMDPCLGASGSVTIIAGDVGAEGQALEEQLARFADVCPDIEVNVASRPDSATEALSQYLQFFEAGSSEIDVYQVDIIWPGVVAEHAVDLSEYASEEVIDSHFDAIIETNTVEGRLVAMPWFTDAGLLYYRTDLLEKYELAAPTTWDELEAAAATIQEGERAEGNADFVGFVWQGNAYEGLTCDALEWQVSHGGGDIITPEGVISVNNEGTIAALERAAGWVGSISPEEVTTFDEEGARGVWQAGNAAFMRNWPYAWSLSQAEDSVIAGNVGVSPLPNNGENPSAATLGGWNLMVSQYSENPDAAAALALFLTSEAEQKERAISYSYNPTIETVYSDEEVLEAVPFFGSLFDVFVSAVSRPSTVTGTEYPEVSRLYFEAVHSVLTGASDAQSAMEDLEFAYADLGYEFPE